MNHRRLASMAVFFLLLASVVMAHGDVEEEVEDIDYAELARTMSVQLVGIGSILIIGLMILTWAKKKVIFSHPRYKAAVFGSIVVITVIVTLFTAGSTIALNVISETGGPVHWHADFEVWNCEEEVVLAEASGLANRIGSTVLHVHNDLRVHVEGVLVDKRDADLHNFFKVIGGELTNDLMRIPTDTGVLELQTGQTCNGQPGVLQVFVYKVSNPDDRKNWVYTQSKADANYILSPHSNVPPGDCVIIEFGPLKDSTDKICETFDIAIQKGDLRGG